MELLARRPDLQAARWKLEASLSKIDAAKAAFYPDVNLTGSIGLNSVKAEDLLQLASRTCTSARACRCRCSTASASMRSWTAHAPTATSASPNTTRPSSTPCAKWRKAARSCKASNSRSCSKAQPPAGARPTGIGANAHGARLANNSSVLNARLSLLKQRDADLYLQQVQLLAEVALTNALGGGYHEEAPLATVTK
jgi:multidrug efflux system outer membrane protein